MKNYFLFSFDLKEALPGGYTRAYKILEKAGYTRNIKSTHSKKLSLPSKTVIKITSYDLNLKEEIGQIKSLFINNGLSLGEHYIARADKLRCSKEY